MPFARSADFPEDKPAAQPCRHLQPDFACGIHPGLRQEGWKGCTVFECFGAGQQVSQVTFGGMSWRDAPDTASRMYAVFGVVRQLHEMLWYLREAEELDGGRAAPVREELHGLVASSPEALEALDVTELRARVGAVLHEVSARHRRGTRGTPTHDRGRAPGRRRGPRLEPGADLLGADLRGRDLRAVDLRGTYLIAADLRGSDLRRADLLGADLRDARLEGADLGEALFLTQPQVNAAHGDARTRLPGRLRRPAHWA
ncbi:MAG TPA: pentapeptide repeat-containing protein [Segeticoccus sp.]|uniref:pentapeptide repeat-containing protein n=1 Tax=Segeticoccus sp. TaxID=2706531 RepID=UPI002D7F7ED5|nr:pentapeptide repeat-containing protein [Segeticoccus sp.]HET8598924.1 pentapeptide repeat-containing protein [Segeticoccus sp.]